MFEGKYPIITLGDEIKTTSGGTPSKKKDEYYVGGNIPWLTSGEVNLGYIDSTQNYITQAGLDNSSAKWVPENSVVIAMYGATAGKVGVIRVPVTTNQAVCTLLPNPEFETLYLYYACKNKEKWMLSKCAGAAQPNISQTVIKEMQIEKPPLAIQQQFTILAAQSDKSKFTGFKSQFIEMFGDTESNPMGWQESTLKEICVGKLSYGSGAAATEYDGETRYVRITDITENGELSNDVKSPSVIDEKYLLSDGDILFARSGATVGKTLMYKEVYGRCIYAGFLIRLVPDTSRVLPDYVFGFTKSAFYEDFVKRTQRAVGQPNINAQEYGDLKICIPPMEMQSQFAEFLHQSDKSK